MPPGSASAFEPRGDVDAVAEDVVAVDDHVAEIDADAELDALALCRMPALRSAMPCWTSTAQRTASTTLANSDQQPVAGGLDDAALVLGDLRIDQLARDAP